MSWARELRLRRGRGGELRCKQGGEEVRDRDAPNSETASWLGVVFDASPCA